MRLLCAVVLGLSGVTAVAAELSFDFSKTPAGETPKGFESLRAGEGHLGQWEVIMAEVPPLLAPLSPQAPQTAVKPVLTQTDHDPTDERFPILAYTPEEFGDFTVTTRLRIQGGEKEQMGGIAFRLQDAENFYVLRISALGQNIRFYKVVAGMRGRLIGPSMPIRTNTWYELTVQCEGNQIICSLDGKMVFPALQDMSFTRGKIGFWTKSDSSCQFAGASLIYTPIVPLSERILAAALDKYPRVVDLRLYTLGSEGSMTRVVAAKNTNDLGLAGGKAEANAIRDGEIYFGKGRKTVTAVWPVRDRNGDPVAAAHVVMDSFPGQTEASALSRARPIIKLMEQQVERSQEPFK